jgi:hypothetical protein
MYPVGGALAVGFVDELLEGGRSVIEDSQRGEGVAEVVVCLVVAV